MRLDDSPDCEVCGDEPARDQCPACCRDLCRACIRERSCPHTSDGYHDYAARDQEQGR